MSFFKMKYSKLFYSFLFSSIFIFVSTVLCIKQNDYYNLELVSKKISKMSVDENIGIVFYQFDIKKEYNTLGNIDVIFTDNSMEEMINEKLIYTTLGDEPGVSAVIIAMKHSKDSELYETILEKPNSVNVVISNSDNKQFKLKNNMNFDLKKSVKAMAAF